MTVRVSHAIRAIVTNLILVAGVGLLAHQYVDVVPRWLHVAIIGVSAGLVSVLSTMAVKVLDKFDGIQKEAEGIEHAAQTNGIFAYVHDARVQLVTAFFAAVVCGVVNGGMAVVLAKDNLVSDTVAHRLIAIGYADAFFIVLFAVRVTRLFLQVDNFRRRLFNVIRNEQAKIAMLRALTPSVLMPLTSAEPTPESTGRRRRPQSARASS